MHNTEYLEETVPLTLAGEDGYGEKMKNRLYYLWNSFGVIAGCMFLMSLGMVWMVPQPWAVLIISACTLSYVASAKVCRGHENMWIFVLLGIGVVPQNIDIVYQLRYWFEIVAFGVISKVAVMVLFFFALFSLEEIVVGLIGRKIWPDQKDDERVEEI